MELAKYIEHTNLKPDATVDDIKKLVEEAIQYGFFGVCVNPIYVKLAKSLILESGKDIKVIDFNLIFPIVNIVTVNKIIYDIIFSMIILLIAPYIKNVLWTCMKPKPDTRKKLKNSRKRNQIISDNINQHRQNDD